MTFIGQLLLFLLEVYFWIVIAGVVISWLMAVDVINARAPQAQNLLRLLARATEPVYRPLRRVVPPIGGIDLTPMIVIFGIFMLQNIVSGIFFSPPPIAETFTP